MLLLPGTTPNALLIVSALRVFKSSRKQISHTVPGHRSCLPRRTSASGVPTIVSGCVLINVVFLKSSSLSVNLMMYPLRCQGLFLHCRLVCHPRVLCDSHHILEFFQCSSLACAFISPLLFACASPFVYSSNLKHNFGGAMSLPSSIYSVS